MIGTRLFVKPQAGSREVADTRHYAEFSAAAGLPIEAPEQLSFLDQLEVSESSGKADAEITITDGRRFVWEVAVQEARLQDYHNATGTTVHAGRVLHQGYWCYSGRRSHTWHIADLDKAIDALRRCTPLTMTRDGLRAVAHLGAEVGHEEVCAEQRRLSMPCGRTWDFFAVRTTEQVQQAW